MNQRISELENSNTVLEAQLANKEFKAGILNKFEELSEQQSKEIKSLNSKIILIIPYLKF